MQLKTPKFWYKKTFIAYLLLPLSAIYFLLSILRKLTRKPIKLARNTIIIGNATVGGGGKTPITLYLANLLEQQGHKICILTKGYKGKEKGPYLVQKNDLALNVGDEALLFSKEFSCLLAKKRKSAAKKIQELSPDILLLDDGYQDPNITSNCYILIIDNNFLFGNQLIFPAGPLREGVSKALKKADLVIVIKQNEHEELNKKLIPLLKSKPIFIASPRSEKEKENTSYIAFSGLALNSKFFNMLKQNGYKISKTIEYPDHYLYKKIDIEKLILKAQQENLQLITTEKDIVKIPQEFHHKIRVYPYKLLINEPELLNNEISKILQRS